MCPSANLHLRNQQQPGRRQIFCPTHGCTDTYASASVLTLHIHRGNHHFGPAQGHAHEHIPPRSPTAPNPQANLRELSSSPPVHPDAFLFNAPEEVVDPDVASQQYPSSSSSNPHQPLRSPSAPLHPSPDADIPQGSPMNVDGDLPSAGTQSSSSQPTSPRGGHSNNLNEQISSVLGSLFVERAALHDDSSSDPPPHNHTGVPVNRNYHPHLNGKLSFLFFTSPT